MKKKEYDNLDITIFKTRKEMGEKISYDVVNAIKTTLKKKDKVRMIFACAPSQEDFLKEFVKADIDWGRIESFHMDEYCNLENDKLGFAQFIKDNLTNLVPITNAHYIEPDEPEKRRAYVTALTAEPIDIVCLGIGENGHLAFNDPGVADFNDSEILKEVELDDVCRQQQVNDGCFPTFNDVPKSAVTLTIPVLTAPTYTFCIVPGSTKKAILEKFIVSSVQDSIPCTILKYQKNCWIYTDQDLNIKGNNDE